MTKPSTAEGYSNQVTENCERVLVTLLRGLGPWRDSIFLVGGLAPRYLIEKKPPEIPAHAGTGDVDVVVQLQLLNDTKAYHSLEDNFKKLGLTRGTNGKGQSVSWRWEISTGGTKVALELLADDPEKSGGKVVELPTDGNVSAMNIPHSGIVFDHHKTREIKAELLGDDGVATVDLHYADLVAFVCLKAYAVNQRAERKDAHDLVYCITHYDGGMDTVVNEFKAALGGKHKDVVAAALALLARHFIDDATVEGYKKDGAVAVAKFELGEDADQDTRILRQREVSDLISTLLQQLDLLK